MRWSPSEQRYSGRRKTGCGWSIFYCAPKFEIEYQFLKSFLKTELTCCWGYPQEPDLVPFRLRSIYSKPFWRIIKLALFIQVAETTHASFVDKSLDLMCDDYPVYYYAYYTICDFYKTPANMIVSTFNKKYSLLENISVSFFGHQQFTTYPLSNSLN